MTPYYQILADQSDVTATLRERLLSLTITDEVGYQSDSVEIELDDRGGKIKLPRRGVKLDVRIGFKESGLDKMGLFIVDEVEVKGPPASLTVRARSADLRDELKDQKTRSWSDTTLEQVVSDVAADHALTLRMPPPPPSIHLPHLDQSNESDLNLLTRLARRWDYTFKLSGDRLVFVPAGQAVAASGKTVTSVSIKRDQVKDYRVTLADRSRYQSVVAYWQDTEQGTRAPERVGEGEPAFTLRHTYPTAAQAASAARSRLNQLNRGKSTASLTLSLGDTALLAQSELALSGFRSGVDGKWLATRVVHKLTQSGYVTTADAEIQAA